MAVRCGEKLRSAISSAAEFEAARQGGPVNTLPKQPSKELPTVRAIRAVSAWRLPKIWGVA